MSVVRHRGTHHAHHPSAVSFPAQSFPAQSFPAQSVPARRERTAQSGGKFAPGTASAKICRAGTVPPI